MFLCLVNKIVNSQICLSFMGYHFYRMMGVKHRTPQMSTSFAIKVRTGKDIVTMIVVTHLPNVHLYCRTLGLAQCLQSPFLSLIMKGVEVS